MCKRRGEGTRYKHLVTVQMRGLRYPVLPRTDREGLDLGLAGFWCEKGGSRKCEDGRRIHSRKSGKFLRIDQHVDLLWLHPMLKLNLKLTWILMYDLVLFSI